MNGILDAIFSIEPETGTLLLSIAALVISVVASILGALRKSADDRRQMRGTFNDLLSQISTLKTSLDIALAEGYTATDLPIFNARTGALQKQIAALVSRAAEMHNAANLPLSVAELTIMAEAMALKSAPLAEGYWRRAIAASAEPGDRFAAAVGFGDLLYSLGRNTEATAQFDAVRAMLAPNDFDALGRACYAQANFEARAGLLDEARRSYSAARRAYEQMPNASLRAFRLRDLEQAQEKTLGAHTPAA
jgi:tetratricopeptide (TPR) repeat protein